MGCSKDLDKILFSVRKDRPVGVRSKCKRCVNRLQRDKGRTLEGLIRNTYNSMLARIRGKRTGKKHIYYGLPVLDRETFYEWSINNPDYITLHKQWVRSNYDYKLTPSIDRIHPDRGYELLNMGWVTVSENSKRANAWRWHNQII